MEILKYLSDTNEYKPLNEFIKSISKGQSIQAIKSVLREMYNDPRLKDYSEDVAYFNGYYDYLGEAYTENLDGRSKVLRIKADNVFSNDSTDVLDTKIGDLDNCPFEGRITAKGRKELAEHELQQSIHSTNKSVKRTNSITLIIAGLATLFSLTSVIIAFKKDAPMQVQELKETNSILQKQSQTLESLLQKLNFPRQNDTLGE